MTPRLEAQGGPARGPASNTFINLSLILMLVAATALRLPYLTTRSIWYDEASSWQTASFPFPALMESLRCNVHMPLYYANLKIWMSLFGDSVAALRGLSVAFGVLTVLFISLAAREVYLASAAASESGDDATRARRARGFGLAVGWMVALSPFQVMASIEARMYATGTALASLSLWLALRAIRRGARGWPWWGLGITCLGLTYVHHYGSLSVAAEFALIYGVGMWRLGSGEPAEARRMLGRLAVVALAVGAGDLPGLEMLRGQVAHVRQDYWIRPMTLRSVPVAFAEFALPLPRKDAPVAFGWLSAGVFAASCVVLLRRARVGDAAALVASLGPLALAAALSLSTPIWEPRYFRFAHLAMLTTLCLAAWRITASRPAARRAVLAGLLSALLAGNVAFWRAMDLDGKPGPRRVAELILDGYRDGELVLALDSVQYFPLKYYLGRRARVRLLRPNVEPGWGDHLVRPSDRIEPGDLASEARHGLWVVGTRTRPLGLDLPGEMTVAGSDRVSFYNSLHGTLYLTHYRPRGRGGPPGRGSEEAR